MVCSIRNLICISPNKLGVSLLVFTAALLVGCGSGGGNSENKTGALTPSSIAITPANTTISKGNIANFTATATYSDGSSAPISNGVVWETANTGIATIDSSNGAAKGVAVGSTKVSATLSGVTSPTVDLNVTDAVISTISISTTTPSVPKGRFAEFMALAVFSDGQPGTVTGSVTWSSDAPLIATLDTPGKLKTLAEGSTNISTSILVGTSVVKSPSYKLTVTPPVLDSLAFTSSTATIEVGRIYQFRVSGKLTDGTSVNGNTLPITFTLRNPINATATNISSATETWVQVQVSFVNNFDIVANSGNLSTVMTVSVIPAATTAPAAPVLYGSGTQLNWLAVPYARSYNVYTNTSAQGWVLRGNYLLPTAFNARPPVTPSSGTISSDCRVGAVNEFGETMSNIITVTDSWVTIK